MGKINLANFKKTYYYLKKNGVKAAFTAVCERLRKSPLDAYAYERPSDEELMRQRREIFKEPVTISLLVPAFNTKRTYLDALLLSVWEQTYPYWELVLADAGSDLEVRETVEEFVRERQETRIRYIRLDTNEGIAANSNRGLEKVTGDYVGLLDHDDLLAPDALYENAVRIMNAKKRGITLKILYSDEDKCDEKGESYYEIYRKKDFNLDLLLSNNYICHFLVMETGMMKKLKFRCNFDGSQDYDLILRGVAEILPDDREISHIPKVLYHWRCHAGSTAVNPESKRYAYDAGKRAIEDFLLQRGIHGDVEATEHLGFFRISYEPDVFEARGDIGVLGGRLLDRKNRVVGGIYDPTGICPYAGLAAGFSGYMHQASLTQDAKIVDIRFMKVRRELWKLFEEITGIPYREAAEGGFFDGRLLPAGTDYFDLSRRVCEAVTAKGYRILWDPKETLKIK